MASGSQQRPLYPQIIDSNPDLNSPFLSNPNPNHSHLYPSLQSSPPPTNPNPNPSSSSSLYPAIDMTDLAENLFPEDDPSAPTLPSPVEETLLCIPGAILHLIDRQQSIELASGDLSIIRLRQGESTIAVLVRVDGNDSVQWPLARDEAAVKLDSSHYFFSLHVPPTQDNPSPPGDYDDLLSYGLTFASKGQEGLLKELDAVLEKYSSFSVHKVAPERSGSDVLDGLVAKGVAPAEMKDGKKKEMMEEQSAAYWTTLAPNVEEYSGSVARVIAKGSGQLIRGIIWCGDVTVERLKWGEDFMRRTGANSKETEVSKDALKRMKRVKSVTKMSEKVATGILSGVVKVSGFVTSPIVNSKAGKKFFSLLPGEIILASLDGFGKICDAVEVAGKNVMQTTSVVTTGVVSHKYGDQAGEITNEGFSAAGHAMGTAWAVFKIRKALNPKSLMKPTTLAKSAVKAAAADVKAKKAK